MAHEGGCLCGEVRYSVIEFVDSVANCHCKMCQRHTGAPYATYACVEANNFRWLQGEQLLQNYTANNKTTRRFCGNCGSSLTFVSPLETADVIELSLATLDGDSPVKPDAHIFLESKANWTELNDDLGKFVQGRSGDSWE